MTAITSDYIYICIVHPQMVIALERWPNMCEFITWTVVLWNRWIRLSCYYTSI